MTSSGASALTACEHPYSTYNFYNEHTHWADVSRANVAKGDAFVHNSGGSGHIFSCRMSFGKDCAIMGARPARRNDAGGVSGYLSDKY